MAEVKLIRVNYIIYDLNSGHFLSCKETNGFSKSFKQAIVYKSKLYAEKKIGLMLRVRDKKINQRNMISIPVNIELDEKVLFKDQLSGRGDC